MHTPTVGSSRIKRGGSCNKQLARLVRLACPPLQHFTLNYNTFNESYKNGSIKTTTTSLICTMCACTCMHFITSGAYVTDKLVLI